MRCGGGRTSGARPVRRVAGSCRALSHTHTVGAHGEGPYRANFPNVSEKERAHQFNVCVSSGAGFDRSVGRLIPLLPHSKYAASEQVSEAALP